MQLDANNLQTESFLSTEASSRERDDFPSLSAIICRSPMQPCSLLLLPSPAQLELNISQNPISICGIISTQGSLRCMI